jgi:pimeloyl-ACP methyl ester carboxylesterase
MRSVRTRSGRGRWTWTLAGALAASGLCLLGGCSDSAAPDDHGTDQRGGVDATGMDTAPVDSTMGDGSAPDSGDLPLTVPTAGEVEPGVYREIFPVATDQPAPNPSATTNADTPAELNSVNVVRYRAPGDPAPAARAVVIAQAGKTAGAGTFDELARRVVKLSQGQVEFWSIERRENALEDSVGMMAAQAQSNAQVARDYYFNAKPVGGQTFAGYHMQDDLAYMSEWGLATHVKDTRAVINQIPQANRKTNVILLGHSLGANLAQAYAGWDFDGTAGVDDIGGLVLVEGGTLAAPLDEAGYHQGIAGGFFDNLPGIDGLRSDGPRYLDFPVLGLDAYLALQITGLAALTDPDSPNTDPEVKKALGVLMGVPIPHLTNTSAFGMVCDDQFTPINLLRVSAGNATGGPLESYNSILDGTRLLRPSDSRATYTWLDYDQSTPKEATPIKTIARMVTEATANFVEWYFPLRLPLDLAAISDQMDIPADDWRRGFDLNLQHNATMDAPVLAIGGELGLTTDVNGWNDYRDLVAPMIGEGRPAAGSTRTDPMAFNAVIVPKLTHIDVLSATTTTNDPATLVVNFAMTNTTGTVVVP